VKLFCKDYHWAVKDGQLLLGTPNDKATDLAKQVITVLEQQIRNQIVADIMAWNPIQNRKKIVKLAGSLDNALFGVQAICADIAAGIRDTSPREEN
jgi:hypothetical protein